MFELHDRVSLSKGGASFLNHKFQYLRPMARAGMTGTVVAFEGDNPRVKFDELQPAMHDSEGYLMAFGEVVPLEKGATA